LNTIKRFTAQVIWFRSPAVNNKKLSLFLVLAFALAGASYGQRTIYKDNAYVRGGYYYTTTAQSAIEIGQRPNGDQITVTFEKVKFGTAFDVIITSVALHPRLVFIKCVFQNTGGGYPCMWFQNACDVELKDCSFESKAPGGWTYPAMFFAGDAADSHLDPKKSDLNGVPIQ
jgi:hypothetical protein